MTTALAGRAAVTERRTRAVELALAGYSYDEIAEQLGYANRSGAWKAIQGVLDAQLVEGVSQYRRLELARLDALQSAHWTEATAEGSTKAADLILKIMDRRMKLLGLDQIPPPQEQHRTILVQGNSEEYCAGLQQIIDAAAERKPDRTRHALEVPSG